MTKVINFINKKSSINLCQKIDIHKVNNEGFQVIRNFGINEESFINQIKKLSKNNLYFSKRMDSSIHKFQTLPFSENLSESPKSGDFHTDFMFQEAPPEFIVLCCLQPDPKYPLLGRNQIVRVLDLFSALHNTFKIPKTQLFKITLPFTINNKTHWEPLFSRDHRNNIIMKCHLSFLDKQKCFHLIHSIPLHALLENLCMQYATNLVLNTGDILVISNKYALHKRTECSVHFDETGKIKSREMISIRFNT